MAPNQLFLRGCHIFGAPPPHSTPKPHAQSISLILLGAVLRDIPFAAVQFTLYDALKRRAAVGEDGRQRHPHWAEKLLYQSLSAALAGGITTPLDVVKTRLMTQKSGSGSKGLRYYKGWWDALRTIHREEGAMALLNGIRPRVLWLGLGGAIFMGSFEEITEVLLSRPLQ